MDYNINTHHNDIRYLTYSVETTNHEVWEITMPDITSLAIATARCDRKTETSKHRLKSLQFTIFTGIVILFYISTLNMEFNMPVKTILNITITLIMLCSIVLSDVIIDTLPTVKFNRNGLTLDNLCELYRICTNKDVQVNRIVVSDSSIGFAYTEKDTHFEFEITDCYGVNGNSITIEYVPYLTTK